MNSDSVKESVRSVLDAEANSILSLGADLPASVETAVEWIFRCQGRVLTCGIGKSGHIARKTAGTLSSTGTPSAFLHAAEAVHGDLGMVTDKDIVILYSHSGETDEVVNMFVPLHAIGAQTILMTGRVSSSAANLAHLVVDTGVREEACPNNLAPTTSTTVMLALSDAIAVAVMKLRNFGREDFAKFHPSGALGKRLLLTVSDVMRSGSDISVVRAETPILDALKSITTAGAGAAVVLSDDRKLAGFLSDGDIRRGLLTEVPPSTVRVRDWMSQGSFTIQSTLLAIEALEVFQNLERKIGEMPVVNEKDEVIGLLVLKDLLRAGIL